MENHWQKVASKLAVEFAQAKFDLANAQVQIETLQQQLQQTEEEK